MAISAVLAGYFVFAAVMIAKHGSYIRWFGWGSDFRQGMGMVTAVNDKGPVAEILVVGDRVLAINGDKRVQIVGSAPLLWWEQGWEPRTTSYTLLIDRQGEEFEVEVTPTIFQDKKRWMWKVPIYVSALAFWVVSTLIGLLRPGERMPQLMVVTGFATVCALLNATILKSWWFMSKWEFVAAFALTCVHPINLFLNYVLAAMFVTPGTMSGGRSPVKIPDSESTLAVLPSHEDTLNLPPGDGLSLHQGPGRLWWWVGVILLVWTTIYFTINMMTKVLAIPSLSGSIDFLARHLWFFEPWYRHLDLHFVVYVSVTSGSMVAVILSNYRRLPDPDQKRRIKWVAWGSVAGALPWSAVIAITFVLGKSFRTDPFWSQLFVYGLGAVILAPISLGHAVVKNRILGVDVVIRRGLKYLLAKNLLRLVLLAPVLALVYSILANPDRTVTEIVSTGSRPLSLGVAVFAGLGLRYRRRLTDGLDRRFFRTRYDQEKILGELITSLKEEESLDSIAVLIEDRIISALHPETIIVAYRHPENPEFVSSTHGLGLNTSVSEDSELVRLAESSDHPIDLGPGNRHRRSLLPAHELDRLDALGVELVVPMQGPSIRLAGLILLGAKKSEEAYSASDKTLLKSIADQTAVVWENRWLTDRVNREGKVRREVLAHLGSSQINLLRECLTCGACYDNTEETCSEDGTNLELTMPVERIIDERYRLDRLLGRGGMGAVFRSTDLRLDRSVAVKIMMGHLFGDRTAQRRFEREARTSAGLRHQRIIQIHDFGGIGDNGAYLVMELVEGETLRSRLTRVRRIDPSVAAEIVDGVLDGLTAAHDAGVIHRDLKPENVMLTGPATDNEIRPRQPDIKILDFGLAKLMTADDDSSAALTATGAVLGTWTYMSPEQLLGQVIDERSDLFSVGVMTAEAITGRRPFKGETPTEMLRSLEHDKVSLSGSGAGVASLEAILRIATAREISRRYESAAEMRLALVPGLRSCPELD